MNIFDVKTKVDKADTIRRQIEHKNKEMEDALAELARVQKNIASIGQDIEKLKINLEKAEAELLPTLADYIQAPKRKIAIS